MFGHFDPAFSWSVREFKIRRESCAENFSNLTTGQANHGAHTEIPFYMSASSLHLASESLKVRVVHVPLQDTAVRGPGK
jgi:hypothetical protein